MEIKLRANKPTYKSRLKSGIDFWCVAAIIGLLGTWFSGTTIEDTGTGAADVQLSVAITPLAGIATFLWFAAVFWWYRQRALRTGAYRIAAQEHGDFLVLDDYGVNWGIVDVATTRLAWNAVGFYRLDQSKRLELGTPAHLIEVPIEEFDGASVDEIEALLQSKGVRKLK